MRGGGWDGLSSSHPVRASARIGVGEAEAEAGHAVGGWGRGGGDLAASATPFPPGTAAASLPPSSPPRDGGPPPAAPLVWVAECVVDGAVAGTGVDVHRATAEQAAAKAALAAVFGVDADAVWRAKVADQM